MDLYTLEVMRKPKTPDDAVPVDPFLKFLADAKRKDFGYNASQFARDNNLSPQQITNWKARGYIPKDTLDVVAKGMGITYDAYMTLVRGKSPKQSTIDAAVLLKDYDALPGGLKEIVARKASELRAYYEACSPLMQKLMQQPPDPTRSREWEQDIEADMARLLIGKKPDQR